MPKLAVNGIHLNVDVRGEGLPLLLLHGFTGSAANWAPLVPYWSAFRTIAVDLIGHGLSDAPADPARYTVEACGDDLAAVLDQLGAGKAAVLGYSMGGRLALHFALRRPERVAALMLESASPGLADAQERAARVRSDEDLARRIESEGVPAFVEYWERLPLWDSQAGLPPTVRARLRQQRLRNSATGLANSLRGMGAGAQEAVHTRLAEIACPALLIGGALDERYAALAREMAAAISGAEARVIDAAGHATHLERPEEFALAVSGFLSTCLAITGVEA